MKRIQHKSSYKPLYGILAVFIIPLLLAHSLFHFGYGKQHPNSKGTLLTPPITINTKPVKYWQIASLNTAAPNPQQLHTLTQRWHALGRDKPRVHLTLFTSQATNPQKHPTVMTPSDWSRQDIDQKTLALLQNAQSKRHAHCQLFIIDPENRAILCYDNHNELRDLDLDLRKLLKSSRV